ncbi:hypothetical protein ACFX2I_024508 [Malus domestica]
MRWTPDRESRRNWSNRDEVDDRRRIRNPQTRRRHQGLQDQDRSASETAIRYLQNADPLLAPWEISDFEEQREETIFRFSSKAASGRVESGNRFPLKKRTGSKEKKCVDAEAEKDEERWRANHSCFISLVHEMRRKTGKNVATAQRGWSSSKVNFSIFPLFLVSVWLLIQKENRGFTVLTSLRENGDREALIFLSRSPIGNISGGSRGWVDGERLAAGGLFPRRGREIKRDEERRRKEKEYSYFLIF